MIYVGHLEVELWHLEGSQVLRSGQSLMTSISGPEGQIDLNIGGTNRLMIINQHTKFHQNQRRSCKCHPVLIDLTWNAPLPKNKQAVMCRTCFQLESWIVYTIHSFHMDVMYCLYFPLSVIDENMLPYSYGLNYS